MTPTKSISAAAILALYKSFNWFSIFIYIFSRNACLTKITKLPKNATKNITHINTVEFIDVKFNRNTSLYSYSVIDTDDICLILIIFKYIYHTKTTNY